tara:strand:+ start:210 stop:833 length:624 start_codon:yes stop_codon:yes gene_type:complete
MKTITLRYIEDFLTSELKGALRHIAIRRGELCIEVSPKDFLQTLILLRDHPDLAFRQLVDICGVDYPDRAPRFEVVYHLLSHRYNNRIRLKAGVGEGELMPTASHLFKAANWYEREIWDLYGVGFEGHPDLRRLLTDYGFEGHPLRKDFPLTGFSEVRYDFEKEKVAYAPVNLPQDFRQFDFESPWKAMTPEQVILPGDEKATRDIL